MATFNASAAIAAATAALSGLHQQANSDDKDQSSAISQTSGTLGATVAKAQSPQRNSLGKRPHSASNLGNPGLTDDSSKASSNHTASTPGSLETRSNQNDQNLPEEIAAQLLTNSNGVFLVSDQTSRVDDLLKLCSAEFKKIPCPDEIPKHTDHNFYEVTINGKKAYLSELVIKNETSASDALSFGFIRHTAVSHFKHEQEIQSTKNSRSDQTKALINKFNKDVAYIAGAGWVEEQPTRTTKKQKIQNTVQTIQHTEQKTPAGCAFAAVQNFLRRLGVPEKDNTALQPKDYAEHLVNNKEDNGPGLFSKEILEAIKDNNSHTLYKQKFIESLSGNEALNLYCYHLGITNPEQTTAKELWDILISKTESFKPNTQKHSLFKKIATIFNSDQTNNTNEITLTPDLWFFGINAINPHELLTLLKNNFSSDKDEFEFSQTNLKNDREFNEDSFVEIFPKDAKPSIIALKEDDDGNGLNHFVTITLDGDHWYLLDSLKQEPETFCERKNLVEILQKRKMNSITFPQKTPGQ